MRVALAISALAGLTAVSLVVSQARGAGAGSQATPPPRRPVVVELFTSEGCSSCPPADRVLRELAAGQGEGGAEVIALELHVDYWNDLGWRDPFSSAAYSARQASYGASRVYTPQMIVGGGEEFVGSDAMHARAAIARAAAAERDVAAVPVALHVTRPAGSDAPLAVSVQVDVGAHAAPADLWLAITEDGLATDVTRGENAGAHLLHAPVVRLLRLAAPLPPSRTATTQRTSLVLAPAWKRPALRVVAFVQERGERGPGAISGAAAARLP
jgi:hypothetical protein